MLFTRAVCGSSLLEELKELNARHPDDTEDSKDGDLTASQSVKGVLADR